MIETEEIRVVGFDQLDVGMAGDGYDIREPVDVAGLSVHFARIRKGSTRKGLYRGLPGDACPCAHWTYVIKGRAKVMTNSGAHAVVSAGDLCYSPPGHSWEILEDIEFVELSSPSFAPVLAHLRGMRDAETSPSGQVHG